MRDAPVEEANRLAERIGTMIDGFWLGLQVNADIYSRNGAAEGILLLVERLIPNFDAA